MVWGSASFDLFFAVWDKCSILFPEFVVSRCFGRDLVPAPWGFELP